MTAPARSTPPRGLLRALEISPIFAFSLCSLAGEGDQSRFLVGAGVALLAMGFLALRRWAFNPLILGGCLFILLVGANYALYLATGARIPGLADALLTLRESGWFLMLLAVGLAATLASPRGYVGVEDSAPADRVRQASWILLAATLAGLVLSHVFRGQETYSAVLPIVGLFVLQGGLKRRIAAKAGAPA